MPSSYDQKVITQSMPPSLSRATNATEAQGRKHEEPGKESSQMASPSGRKYS
jgi:hypothetical protein